MSVAQLLRLNGLPVYQNKMFATESAARQCERGDVVLVQDGSTGFIYNQAFDPAVMRYDNTYQNEQGYSSSFNAHTRMALAAIDRHFQQLDILEIGCGKGAFLDLLIDAGYAATGIDAAYEGESPHIVRRHFDADAGVRGDGIVMRHVLEHIPLPFAFLDSVRQANGGSGRVYIEVPCFDWILENNAWFDIFYEHVNYFRLTDFFRLFGTILESGRLFGGQYIYVIAELDSLRNPADSGDGFGRTALPSDFFAGMDRCVGAAGAFSRTAVWGAAAKGVMFCHHMQARGAPPNFAIDINPAKQLKFLAGSGIAVVAPDEGLATLGSRPGVFVMNSNYIEEIRRIGGDQPSYIDVENL